MLFSATLRSLSIVVVGAFVSFCTVQTLNFCQCENVRAERFNADVADSLVWQTNDPNLSHFSVTSQLPLVEDTPFGWRLHLENAPKTVRLREVFVLPSAPSNWGIGPETSLSHDGRVAFTEEVVQTENGWLGHIWSISEGDPPGPYEMHIFINDQLVHIFHFNATVPRAAQPAQDFVLNDDGEEEPEEHKGCEH
ncbi:MAG: hypothetical protein GY822_31895 [Deltaproteobacteria bacterium]|nr:hypothetical protein [Deltaproteobacteria bacterium]